jgi:hypothetical protein
MTTGRCWRVQFNGCDLPQKICWRIQGWFQGGAVSDDIKNARHLNFVEGERGDERTACILGIACRRVSVLRTQCFTVQMGDKDQYL